MSARPDVPPPAPRLAGPEGELITVAIATPPRRLEALLEALARLDFPVNPQLYHDACVVHVRADGAEIEEPATLVEFPAWAARLPEIRRALEAAAFPQEALAYLPILESLRQPCFRTASPPGSPSGAILLYRSAADRRRAGGAARPHANPASPR